MATLLLTAALASFPASSSAAFTHPLIRVFGSFTHPSGIGIDESSPATRGNVLVADGSGSNVVDIFGPRGENPTGVASPFKIAGFAFNNEPSGLAVDNSTTSPSKGDLYVADVQNNAVKKFKLNPITEEYEYLESLAATGGFGEPLGVAVDSKGIVYVANYSPPAIIEFNPAGVETGRIIRGSPPSSLGFDSVGDMFVQDYSGGHVSKLTLNATGEVTGEEAIADGATGLAVDPGGNTLYLGFGSHITEYAPATGSPEAKGEFSGNGTLGSTARIAVNAETHDIYVTDGGAGDAAIFGPKAIVPDVTTGSATTLRTTATVNGEVDDAGGDPIIECKFEYVPQGFGYSSGEAKSTPCLEGLPFTGHQAVSANLTNLNDEAVYDYRLSAASDLGGNQGLSQTLETGLAVTGLTTDPATELTPTGATLNGSFSGDGNDTHYYFQYGVEEGVYGQTTPTADAGSPSTPTNVAPVTIGGLVGHHIYHFRIVATNSFGTTYGPDQSFLTPSGPEIGGLASENVTAESADLTAKVNPENAPTSCHFEYGTTVAYGATVPCPGSSLTGTTAQLVSVHLSGLQPVSYHFRIVAENPYGTATSGDQTFNFYPQNCPNLHVRQQTGGEFLPDCRAYELVSAANAGGAVIFGGEGIRQDSPYADNTFAYGAGLGLIPNAGPATNADIDRYVATRTSNGWITHYVGVPGDETSENEHQFGSLDGSRWLSTRAGSLFEEGALVETAPQIRDNEDNLLGQLPTNVAEVQNGTEVVGTFKPSPDFSHFIFSSKAQFAPGGLVGGLGSAYDNLVSKKTISIISKTPQGEDIPTGAGGAGEEIHYPAISTDGSRILMSTAASNGGLHLYMRENDAVSYDVSIGTDGENHGVNLIGMTSDGSKVFFSSSEQLTADDTDTSADIFMWSKPANGPPSVVRISTANNGAGNSDACAPASGWTSGCNAVAVNGLTESDNSIATTSGDIYFYSPEQLDGSKGVPNQENLYVYHDGAVQHVLTFAPGGYCETGVDGFEERCTNQPVARIQVSPDGEHMAFITSQQMTAYENNGFGEMYTWDPTNAQINCVSCNPSGEPPVGQIKGSTDGLFMTNDGRTFFYSPDALVPQDTDKLYDVYEYSEGRPQLISSGTGSRDVSIISAGSGDSTTFREATFMGVSADGLNVYFGTYDTLVGQDLNGDFLKIYDARTNGGFPFVPPSAPCAAADECHGAGSSPPPPPQLGSTASLGGRGTVTPSTKHKNHKRRHAHKKSTHTRSRREASTRHVAGGGR